MIARMKSGGVEQPNVQYAVHARVLKYNYLFQCELKIINVVIPHRIALFFGRMSVHTLVFRKSAKTIIWA